MATRREANFTTEKFDEAERGNKNSAVILRRCRCPPTIFREDLSQAPIHPWHHRLLRAGACHLGWTCQHRGHRTRAAGLNSNRRGYPADNGAVDAFCSS